MPVTITIDGLPSACHYCGHQAEGWPVRVLNGEVIVACPECHSRIAPVFAVPAEAVAHPDTAAMDRVAAAFNEWGTSADVFGDLLVEIIGIVSGTGRTLAEPDDPECE
jgi:DNA-directed RNA polymerase subunit RPC12/RpoP